MENPQEQIAGVIGLLTSAKDADTQKEAVYQYFTSDAGFRHPLCSVAPGPNSRETILGIYQWYRVMSPTLDIDVQEVAYHKETNTLYVTATQKFHIRISPFKAADSSLTVRISLRELDGKHYIAFQEDFYHTDELLNLIIPPLVPIARFALAGASYVSSFQASVGQMLGIWKPTGSSSKSK